MTEPALPLPPPYTAETISEYVDALIGFEMEYKRIASFHSHEVFTKGFPVDWAPKYDAETWLSFIAGDVSEQSLPAPLAKFMRLARELPLVGFGPKLDSVEVQKNRKKFSPKKAYEVDVFIKYINETSEKFDIETKRVVDVGAGLGYLSQELVKAGFQVTAIEGDPERAAKTAESAGIECIAKMVNSPDDLDITPDPCLAVSLHACGELSVHMIRYFIQHENVRLLVNTGCCYNRCSPGTENFKAFIDGDSFPMSKFFRDKGVKKMSRDFRDLASHCVKRLTPDHLNEIKVQAGKHFYRAVLEVLFVRHGIDSVVGRTPNSVYLNPFVEYVRTVVKKHGLSESLIEEADIIDSYAVEDALASMLLRRMCAGVLESLIILDRCMAVREALTGGYVGLHMLFERETSPRGWAIVASRS